MYVSTAVPPPLNAPNMVWKTLRYVCCGSRAAVEGNGEAADKSGKASALQGSDVQVWAGGIAGGSGR
eukprot:4629340-Prymnesium_polylepis.2